MSESIITYDNNGLMNRTCFPIEDYVIKVITDPEDYSGEYESEEYGEGKNRNKNNNDENNCSGFDIGCKIKNFFNNVGNKLKEIKNKLIIAGLGAVGAGLFIFIIVCFAGFIIGIIVLKIVFKVI